MIRPPYSLRKKGAGWEIRLTENGKQSSHSFRGTEKDAHAHAAQLLKEKKEGTWVPPSNLTVADLLREWQQARAAGGIEPTTWRSGDWAIRCHLNPAFGSLPIEKLTTLHLDRLYTAMMKHYSDNSRRLVHTTINACLSWAVKKQLLTRNVAKYAERPVGSPKPVAVLSEEQTSLLIDAAKGTTLYLPIMIAAHTGMRVGEVAALCWEDIDFDKGLIFLQSSSQPIIRSVRDNAPKIGRMAGKVQGHTRIKAPKSGKPRYVGLSPSLIQTLLPLRSSGRVCLNDQGQPRTANALGLAFRTFARSLGLEIHFHCLRHGAATHLTQANVHPSIMGKMLGHASWAMTDHYSHPDTAALHRAAAALGNSLEPSLER
jgi:integrase